MNISARILIVDDDPALREVLGLQLQRWGCTVADAANGEEALLSAERMRPDVILLDIFMPELDGLAALRMLKARSAGSKVLMISGAVQSDSGCDFLQMSAKLGADAVLHKPFSSAELAATLKTLVTPAGLPA